MLFSPNLCHTSIEKRGAEEVKKRFFSAITAFIMLISCMNITTASAGEYTTYNLVTFRGESLNANVSGTYASQANDFGDTPYTNSLKWTLRGYIEYRPETQVDWTAYEDIVIRLHSSVAQKFNLVFSGPATWVSGQYTRVLTEVTSGWQDVTIPVSTISAALGYSTDGKSIGFIRFDHNGWGNNAYVSGSTVHIDSISLRKTGFKILTTQPEDAYEGADASAGFQYKVNFNNALDESEDYSAYINIADSAGNPVEKTKYTVAPSAKTLTLTFNEDLLYETQYRVKLAAALPDEEGNTLGEEAVFTFTTCDEPLRISDDGTVFSASSSEDMANIIANGAAEETQNTFIFSTAAKIEYRAGVEKTTVIAYKNGDISGYTHVNYLIYNPQACDEQINLLMYSKNGAYYHRAPATDWEGWKVLSLPIPASNTADPTKMVRFSINFDGWGHERSEDGYLLLGKMWFSDYRIGAISLTETEYENEEDYVSADLGGDNKYSFTYDRELEAVIDSVEVSCLSSGEYVPYTDFTTETDGNKMNIVFLSDLEVGKTYKISVPEECVLAKDFGLNDEAAEMSFTVEERAPYFRLISASPENDETVMASEDFSVTLTFNKAPDRLHDPETYISIYKDDEKQFGLFEATFDGNSVILHFVSAPEAGKTYSIKISQDYCDIYGNKISGDTVTKFHTSEEILDDTHVIFSAGNTDNLQEIVSLSGSSTVNTTNANLNSSNLKLSYSAGKDISLFILKDNVKSAIGMEYANFWIYSPESSDEYMNIVFYTNRSSNMYTIYKLKTDWEGWQLVSVPLSSISSPAKLDSVAINFGGWGTTLSKNRYVLLDEAWLSEAAPQPPALVLASVPDGYASVQAVGASITYEFSGELNAAKGALVTVTNKLSGGTFTDYTKEINGNKVTLNFGTLDENTEYRVEINGLCSKTGMTQTVSSVHSFATSGNNIYVSSINFDSSDLSENGVLTVNYEIVNSSTIAENVICVLNLYDENNVLVSGREYGISCEGIDSETVPLSIDINGDAIRAMAYVKNSAGEILSDKFTTLKGGIVSNNDQSIIAGSQTSLTLDKPNVDINSLSISGTVRGAGNTILLTIAPTSGTAVCTIPLSANTNGTFSYSCLMPSSAPSGKYNVTAVGRGMRAEASFYYISDSDRAEFLRLANGNDTNSASRWIVNHAKALGMDSCSETKATDLATVLLEHEPYETYREAINNLSAISDVLSGLNSCTWAAMGTYLEQFHITALGKDNADYNYFSNLNEKNQNTILINVAKSMPVQTIAEFRKKFAAAVAEYKRTVVTITPDSNGGGSTGPVKQSVTVTPTTSPMTAQNEIFDDLENYPWAKECVEALYNQGIISKADDKKFRPGDNITREEFVKLIICAFYDNLSADEHEFSDADRNAWYSTYLWTAYAEGIAMGYEDGRFGIGENITREDMVTMVCRAISKLGKMPNSKDVSGALNYSDTDSISDYALEYVKIMSEYGIVNGMGDRSFAPKASANRAQAAKVIYQLLELTK